VAHSERNSGRVIALPRPRAPAGGAALRIAPTGPRRAPWYVRLILAAQRRKYGRPLTPSFAWARLPRAFAALTLLYRSLDRPGSAIDPGLRALVQVRVSQLNGCAFCVDANSAAALERNVDPEKLAALAGSADEAVFDARERAALAYADAMTETGRGVDEALFARLRREFDEDAVIELTALVAFQNLTSKFNAALGIPTQGLCAAPSAKEGP
jgi:uncharacterized peroxidase-related enzyme